MTETYLFEIPIYRVSEEQFWEDYDTALDRHFLELYPGEGRAAVDEPVQRQVEDRFFDKYGAPWRYNQAVGWLRIFALGSQLRGDLWFTDAQKLTRNPQRKKIQPRGKAFEFSTFPDQSSEQIVTRLRAHVVSAVTDREKPGVVADLECFDNVAPLIDWQALTGPA
jgi:hypothetical protein